MGFRQRLHTFLVAFLLAGALLGQTLAQSSSSSKHAKKPVGSPADASSVAGGVYRNQALGLTCKIPPGWVLRTEEMNAPEENQPGDTGQIVAQKDSSTPGKVREKVDGRVLLAAFSRPPEAAGEDVNSSILIAQESAATYPGLKDAAQYFGPVTEIAKGQGFSVTNEPYEFPVGAKTLVREDFQKNVGSRVMRQATLVMLARGSVVSFTFIAGSEDDLNDSINGLSFTLARNTGK